MAETTKLIPPDLTQCQAEKRSFMTLGPGYIRCRNVPTVVATEPDPPHGEMSLCEECRRVCEARVPGVSFRVIGDDPSPLCPVCGWPVNGTHCDPADERPASRTPEEQPDE